MYYCVSTYMCTGFVVQVSSVLTELLKNILMSGTTSSLVLASLIPSMLMVEWSTEAVLLLFKQLLQDCTTTIPTPVSVYFNPTYFEIVCSGVQRVVRFVKFSVS